ncbi:MAG: alpha/beta fold hydrolase [Nitrosopumilaceae archaeon]
MNNNGEKKIEFINTKSGKIHSIDFLSTTPSDKIVLCIHGFCCDARIFNYLGRELSKQGFNVKCIDLLGHGKSDGQQGDPEFDQCLNAINEIVTSLKRKFNVYILSHSMGCTFGLWYAKKFKDSFDGLILLAPYLRIKMKKRSDVEPGFFGFLYLFLRRLITPKSRIMVTDALPNYLEVGGDEIASMLKDPKLNFRYSFRYLVDTIAIKNTKVSELSEINVSLLIVHGKKDRQVYHKVGEKFFNLVQSKDKQFKSINCDHWFFDTIFYNQLSDKYSETDRKSVINLLSNWLSTH